MRAFRFESLTLPPEADEMRRKVRTFLQEERDNGGYAAHRTSWSTFDPEFSKRAAKAGFIGMTWPKRYGGGEYSNLQRFVVTEEMLAAGAPGGAHWIADRQSGPQILKHGSERARQLILPKIAAGECYFGIGMSEPDSGSDLAAARTKADKVEGGWVINGTKIWTSNAHRVHYLIVLARTEPPNENRHAGLSQFIVNTGSEGIEIRPIMNVSGGHEFNEVFFKSCFVPDDMMIGKPGEGWTRVTGELAFERAGPDRFMSDIRLLVELVDKVGREPNERQAVEIGRLASHFATLRRMSSSIAGLLERGESPETEAALVKDVGTAFEREVPEMVRKLLPIEASLDDDDEYSQAMAHVLLHAPSFTIRGGTPEILRGMIARGLGLR
ncbi:acyl-CoA dehydrogenase family protein [Bradyrhizobium sp. 182]|uniref:acyl-CoA dehydrogenase family protein n=1 Tax=unclassified Bradyrhizobium TaxID=2631580 RepID=UPI001FFA3256|nr:MULTISPECIES: acyl-CoA dehydrogenase family protein [unclassified Bradyrhizobium]MCK1423110.1 acyl-CoA dehydrogenase family protein [Bradyrhizobium sp. CW12]MCK1529478.1 acyl-CoA dehydrogenase family protein [Bradyrhizobium sp. 182]MCK1643877.1 acyl-CoA dehydrogenase family protein [Bradyrhizobium sp. 154]MCK1668256.1 acyl-CoA dehydrogenase family protein [Bradyrhizobium sp. 153]